MIQAVVNEVKKEEVKELVTLLDQYPIIGIVDMESLPAKNLADMRKQLRDKMTLLMRKKRLIKLAFAQTKKGDINKLDAYLEGMPALLFTKDNPFTLFKAIKKNQSPAPIKAGQTAPEDLIVPAGVTEFAPGPMIGELGAMGIKTAVEGGKIAIKEDAIIAKEGDVVDQKQAGFLSKMGVEPMRIGLKLVAVYENGDILTGKVLNIDEDAFMMDLQQSAGGARSLAIEIAYTTTDTIEALLSKAYMQAGSLAREADILTSDNVSEVLAKANAAATAIQALVPDVPAAKEAAPAEEKTEEASAPEEKSEEAPVKEEAPAEEPKIEAPVVEEKKEEAPAEEPKAEPSESTDAPEKTAEAPSTESSKTAEPEQKPTTNDQPAEPGKDTKDKEE